MVLDRKTTRSEHITVAEGAPLRSRVELGCRQQNAEGGGCQPSPHKETSITPPLPQYSTFIMKLPHTDSSSRGNKSNGVLESLHASPVPPITNARKDMAECLPFPVFTCVALPVTGAANDEVRRSIFRHFELVHGVRSLVCCGR